MDSLKVIESLRALPNKREFAARHSLPYRTLQRLVSGQSNPTLATLQTFSAALSVNKRKR
jgi:predicted transcriptional regulator